MLNPPKTSQTRCPEPVLVRCCQCRRPLLAQAGRRVRYLLRSLSEMHTEHKEGTPAIYLRCGHCNTQTCVTDLHSLLTPVP